MATVGKNKKRPRKHKVGSGMKNVRKARAALRRILLKIKRWEKYQLDDKKVKALTRSKTSRRRKNFWRTDGLKKHAEMLREIIKKGKKRRI